MTRSPGLNASTPAPTLSTTPANSPPGENGKGGLVWYLPATMSVSKKFKPTAATLATTSPGPATGSGMSASTRSSGVPKRWQRTAFMGQDSLENRVGRPIAAAERLCQPSHVYYSAVPTWAIRLHIAEFRKQFTVFEFWCVGVQGPSREVGR